MASSTAAPTPPPKTITLRTPSGASVTATFAEAPPSQFPACDALAHAGFGRGLTEKGFFQAEAYLRDQPLTRNGGLRLFCVRAAADNGEKPPQVFAACRVIPREFLVSDGSSSSFSRPEWPGARKKKHPADVRHEKGYCVAGVVSDEAFRGQGLATFMMERLAEWLDGEGDAAASLLYSSVGEFYARTGWIAPRTRPTLRTTIKVKPDLPWSQLDLPSVWTITSSSVADLCTRDSALLEQEFAAEPAAAAAAAAPDERLLAVVPAPDLVSLQHARSDCYYLFSDVGSGVPPDVRGAHCYAADAWMLWVHHRGRLIVQRVRLPLEPACDGDAGARIAALTALLRAAVEEAARWELGEVAVASPPAELRRAVEILGREVGVEHATEERPMVERPSVRWRGGGAGGGKQQGKTAVVADEYYLHPIGAGIEPVEKEGTQDAEKKTGVQDVKQTGSQDGERTGVQIAEKTVIFADEYYPHN